jgi:hypothetical protein
MSWLYSQALVEEYLGDICLDGEQSVPLNGKPIQQAYCAPDKMTKFSRLSRFGMTYKPLTENLGEELLTLYLEDFHAKTSAQQGEAQELTENDQVCGSTWQGSLARLDPDTLLWKTAQCSLLEDLELSLQTFPRWGLMQNGALYPLPTLVQTISEKEFGLEPNNETFFHTPNTTGMDGGSNSRKALKKRLDQWPTPLASDWKPRGPNSKQQGLGEKVKWPTPTCHNANEKGSPSEFNRDSPGLGTVVLWFPTPQASDNRDRGNMSNPSIQRRIALGKQIMLSQSVDRNSGQLNPTWVEWLMGWPLGWTDLKPLEMDKCHCAQQQPGNCLNE